MRKVLELDEYEAVSMRTIWVSPDGTDGFFTLSQGVEAAEPGDCVSLADGVYREKVLINKRGMRLVGQGTDRTVIIYGDHALKKDEKGVPYGTFRSWTLCVEADDFSARDLRVVNDAGDGSVVGQAVALSVTGDRCRFDRCRFDACQDTLFTGPGNRDEDGGPDDFPRRMFFHHCFISGDVDFIFGAATVLFRHCTLLSRNRNRFPNGYITANSTNGAIPYGYVFDRCRLLGEDGIQDGSVYLGRPWRRFSSAAFIECEMGAHIAPAGWDNWRDPEKEKTVRYGEFGTKGAGASFKERVLWAAQLTEKEAGNCCLHVLGDWETAER